MVDLLTDSSCLAIRNSISSLERELSREITNALRTLQERFEGASTSSPTARLQSTISCVDLGEVERGTDRYMHLSLFDSLVESIPQNYNP